MFTDRYDKAQKELAAVASIVNRLAAASSGRDLIARIEQELDILRPKPAHMKPWIELGMGVLRIPYGSKPRETPRGVVIELRDGRWIDPRVFALREGEKWTPARGSRRERMMAAEQAAARGDRKGDPAGGYREFDIEEGGSDEDDFGSEFDPEDGFAHHHGQGGGGGGGGGRRPPSMMDYLTGRGNGGGGGGGGNGGGGGGGGGGHRHPKRHADRDGRDNRFDMFDGDDHDRYGDYMDMDPMHMMHMAGGDPREMHRMMMMRGRGGHRHGGGGYGRRHGGGRPSLRDLHDLRGEYLRDFGGMAGAAGAGGVAHPSLLPGMRGAGGGAGGGGGGSGGNNQMKIAAWKCPGMHTTSP